MSVRSSCSPLIAAAALAVCSVICFPVGSRAADPPFKRPQGVVEYLAALNESVRPAEEAMSSAIRKGDLAEAERVCRQLTRDVPFAPGGYYNLACLLAMQGQRDEAIKQLEEAVARGFEPAQQILQDPDLASLRDNPRFATLVRQVGKAPVPFDQPELKPYRIVDQTALVNNSNTGVIAGTKLLHAEFLHEVPAAGKLPVTTLTGVAAELLLKWQQEGSIAGNVGDLYDNRDHDHSNLPPALFPQLTWIEYDARAKAAGLDFNFPTRMHHDGVALGNASLADVNEPYWRSLPRLACQNQAAADLLHKQYRENKLYLYPCHLDHSPGRNGKLEGKPGGHGDVYAANTPYVVVSQGSSYTDQPFLQAIAATLAAFRPETKAALKDKGLLMPAVQVILRGSSKLVEKKDDYLSGVAHPPVFEGTNLDVAEMVQVAHDMAPGKLPPLAIVKVVEEDLPLPNRDFFDQRDSEKLFDTPCAVARAWRGTQFARRMTVDASDSFDAHDKPLKFHWQVLRGDAKGIRVKPLNAKQSQVEITVPYHERRPVREGSPLESNRVEIALFVHNGTYYSPPAFITWYSFDNEQREYDKQKRIRSVTYSGAAETGNYVDPLVALPKSWRDEYNYAPDGKLLGWTRRRGDKAEEFAPDGRLVLKRDAAGKPTETAAVRYVARPRGPKQSPMIVQETLPEASSPTQ